MSPLNLACGNCCPPYRKKAWTLARLNVVPVAGWLLPPWSSSPLLSRRSGPLLDCVRASWQLERVTVQSLILSQVPRSIGRDVGAGVLND